MSPEHIASSKEEAHEAKQLLEEEQKLALEEEKKRLEEEKKSSVVQFRSEIYEKTKKVDQEQRREHEKQLARQKLAAKTDAEDAELLTKKMLQEIAHEVELEQRQERLGSVDQLLGSVDSKEVSVTLRYPSLSSAPVPSAPLDYAVNALYLGKKGILQRYCAFLDVYSVKDFDVSSVNFFGSESLSVTYTGPLKFTGDQSVKSVSLKEPRPTEPKIKEPALENIYSGDQETSGTLNFSRNGNQVRSFNGKVIWEFSDGVLSIFFGYGTMTYVNDSVFKKYVGNFWNNKWHGKGRLELRNGDVYLRCDSIGSEWTQQ